ncbi:MAG: hypothetical protein RL216_56 [Pseudomonadota bacterium]|jgi:CRP-like cAMP-binding protein
MIEHHSLRVLQESPFARRLWSFVQLKEEDLAVLSDLYRRRRAFPVGGEIIHQGQIDPSAFVLISGWVASYRVLADGKRQIMDLHLPGDLIGLRSALLRTSDCTVEPITPIKACELLRSDTLFDFTRTPRLATALLLDALQDQALINEHLVDLGRRSAGVRMAHFLLELGSRLRRVGMATCAGYDCPLSQYHLADALGLTAVHVNRVLRELREAGLLTFQRSRVTYGNYDALVQYAGFETGYLDQERPLVA